MPKMHAVRMVAPKRALELQEIDIPEVGGRDVLVKIKAAGICHSDAHYRAGRSPVTPLPMTLGHEVAGVVERTGENVSRLKKGDRVCVHYLATCGECAYCLRGQEQFCVEYQMIGKYRDGGYAEYIVMPARSVFPLPEEVTFEQGAVMMCSSATSFHALRKARIAPGESVAVFGIGGLGFSAVQLAFAFGASQVYAIDIVENKLALAEEFGPIAINAAKVDPVEELYRLSGGVGVDIALELIGLPLTMKQATQSLAVLGRAAFAGITEKGFEVVPYSELLAKEAELIGVNDHHADEFPLLLDWARRGVLDLSRVVTRTVPLDAQRINETLDNLERFSDDMRVVITP